MEYFKSFTESDLIELVNSARTDLYLCLPSIHKELGDAINKKSRSAPDRNKINIHLLIDFEPNTFRQGYGNSDAVKELIKNEIDVKSFKDNRISFIISDNIGYYLFIESRSLIPADKQTVNAIKIDPVSLVRLKKFFFGSAIDIDFEDELANAIIDESLQLNNASKLMLQQTAVVDIISNEKLEEVVEDLKLNPPLNPDYKRIVEFYTNKFQYVKLKFEGSNLQSRKISLPKNVLPIADADLKDRLETKLYLFDQKKINQTFSPLLEFKKLVTELREAYLKKVKSRDESLIDRNMKQEFKNEVRELENSIRKIKLDIVKNVANQIEDSKKRLKDNLIDFLQDNPKTLFTASEISWEDDVDYVKIESENTANDIISSIKWPRAHDLVNEFKLIEQYSDITFEDLKNPQFIKELYNIKLINSHDVNQLAEFGKGIKTE